MLHLSLSPITATESDLSATVLLRGVSNLAKVAHDTATKFASKPCSLIVYYIGGSIYPTWIAGEAKSASTFDSSNLQLRNHA